jgi:hypothetical protein
MSASVRASRLAAKAVENAAEKNNGNVSKILPEGIFKDFSLIFHLVLWARRCCVGGDGLTRFRVSDRAFHSFPNRVDQ